MTSTLWDLRIEHPPGWQQLPSSRLKIKPYDLCSQLYRYTTINLIIVAFLNRKINGAWDQIILLVIIIYYINYLNISCRSPPYKCIAWSDDNIIAFSTVEQLLYSNSIDHVGNIQQPIYIVLPETPQSHITIITPHVDTIRYIHISFNLIVCILYYKKHFTIFRISINLIISFLKPHIEY